MRKLLVTQFVVLFCACAAAESNKCIPISKYYYDPKKVDVMIMKGFYIVTDGPNKQPLKMIVNPGNQVCAEVAAGKLVKGQNDIFCNAALRGTSAQLEFSGLLIACGRILLDAEAAPTTQSAGTGTTSTGVSYMSKAGRVPQPGYYYIQDEYGCRKNLSRRKRNSWCGNFLNTYTKRSKDWLVVEHDRSFTGKCWHLELADKKYNNIFTISECDKQGRYWSEERRYVRLNNVGSKWVFQEYKQTGTYMISLKDVDETYITALSYLYIGPNSYNYNYKLTPITDPAKRV